MNSNIDLKRIRKAIVMQHDQSDCGIACLLALINYYGGDSSLEQLRKLSGTSKQGTTLLGLYQAAKQTGFVAEGCEANIPELIKHGHPVILHLVLEGKYQHYVVCYGYEDDCFVISDPAKGLSFYTVDELNEVWKSHTCLTLSCSDSFVYKKNVSSKKKIWLLNAIKEDFEILGVSIVIGLGIAALGMTMAIFSQKLIDEIIPNKEFTRLWIGILFVFILLVARLGLSAIRQHMLFLQSKDFNNRIIKSFYDRLLQLPRAFFDTRKIGELVARLNDTRRIQQVISTIAGSIIIDTVTSIVTLGFLFYYSWEIALILILSIPIFLYIVYRYNSQIIAAQRNVMIGYAQSESNFINTMQGIDTIKSFNKQSDFGALNHAIYGHFQDNVFSLGKINIKLSFTSGLMSVVLIISILGIGSFFVLNNRLMLGELMAILSLAGSIAPAILNLALVSIPINEAKVAFNRMFEFVNTSTEKSDEEIIQATAHSLSINNLSFRFPGRSSILKNVSFSASINEMTFIIGESGCGKSTLCSLLEKAYIPESGEIILNENDNIQDFSIKNWREFVGVIPQNIYIFNGTVLDNICLGISYTNIEIQSVIEQCTAFGFDKYINQLPQGYMTLVGEEGITLSGGQKQLIALIRLLLKDPQIMILDEPTSAMDRDLERFTLDLLQNVKHDKIIILISHRFHILKKYADKIYLIEQGNVTCSGSHDDVMKFDNIYSNYWSDFELPERSITKNGDILL